MFLADTKLRVAHVEAGGLIDAANSVMHSETLQHGDHIVEVNGVVDPGGLQDELASPHQHTLHMWVVRWPHGRAPCPASVDAGGKFLPRRNYYPWAEPELGYLPLKCGQEVFVFPKTRQAGGPLNMDREYVFGRAADDARGWIPVSLLVEPLAFDAHPAFRCPPPIRQHPSSPAASRQHPGAHPALRCPSADR